VGKGRSKERCRLELQTNFFPFKKSPKTECGLDSRIYGILFCVYHMVACGYLTLLTKMAVPFSVYLVTPVTKIRISFSIYLLTPVTKMTVAPYTYRLL